MPSSIASQMPYGKRKMLSATFAPSENGGKKLSDDQIGRAFGAVIARALELAGMTPQDAADRAGYANQSAISKLTSPVEPSPLARLMSVPGFRPAYILALAETEGMVEVETTVRVPRRAVNA